MLVIENTNNKEICKVRLEIIIMITEKGRRKNTGRNNGDMGRR